MEGWLQVVCTDEGVSSEQKLLREMAALKGFDTLVLADGGNAIFLKRRELLQNPGEKNKILYEKFRLHAFVEETGQKSVVLYDPSQFQICRAGLRFLHWIGDVGGAAARIFHYTSCHMMFSGINSMDSFWLPDLSSFDTSHVTDMRGMFAGNIALRSLDLSTFDTSLVRDMGQMFCGCSSLERLEVSSFMTGEVTDMSCMFEGCHSLRSLDLSSFNTNKVTTMACMFSSCGSLTALNLSSFRTDNVSDMGEMFSFCDKLQGLDLSYFTVTAKTYTNAMLWNCDTNSWKFPESSRFTDKLQ